MSPAAPTQAADDRAFALSWVRLEGAESCPARPHLAAEVAARLGRSPFSPDAEQALEVAVGREEGRWLVRIHARASDGTILGSRVLESDGEDCSAVFSATVLALALTVDPQAGQKSPAPVTPTPESSEPQPSAWGSATPPSPGPAPTTAWPIPAPASVSLADQPDTALAPPTPIARDTTQAGPLPSSTGHLRVAMQVGPALALGLLPEPAPGVIVRGHADTPGGWGFDLGALLLPAHRTGPDHDIADIGVGLSAGFLGASFTPLRDTVSLSIALGGQAGAQHVAVYSPTPLEEGPGNYVWAALRAGGSMGLVLTPPVGIGLAAEAVVPLTRHSYSIIGEAEPAFTTSLVGFVSYLTLNVASN